MKANGCQRTLAITKLETPGAGEVRVTVRSYDDQGRSRPAAGTTVVVSGETAKTNSKGVATVTLSPGRATARAEAKGLVRSFEERIEVK
jgi:6,7-dimethyl-8-ribityllumazine synthase